MVEAIPAEVYFKRAFMLDAHFVAIRADGDRLFPVGVGLGHVLSEERPEDLRQAIQNAWHKIHQHPAGYRPNGIDAIPVYAVLQADQAGGKGIVVQYLNTPRDKQVLLFTHFDEEQALKMLVWSQLRSLSGER